MAPSDVEIVQDQFEATNKRDFARAMDLYAEDVVLVVPPEAFLDAGTFEGRDAVGRYFGEWFSTFEADYHFEIEEIRMEGGFVYMVATHHGHGRSSGVEVSTRTSYLYTVRDGRVARVEIFLTSAAALAAAKGAPSTEG